MIKEALQYILSLQQAPLVEVGGHQYSAEQLKRVLLPSPAALTVNSLTGMVDYIKSNFDNFAKGDLMLHVVDQRSVLLRSPILVDEGRDCYMEAICAPTSFRFGEYLSVESFIIGLQSCFVPNLDSKTMLRVVGNIVESAVKTTGDDGISQSVVAKTGVVLVADTPVPNPVTLAPYRTFREVAQPESQFVFRMRSNGNNGPECALFEADGGTWKLEAMKNVREYLDLALAGAVVGTGDEVSFANIPIIA